MKPLQRTGNSDREHYDKSGRLQRIEFAARELQTRREYAREERGRVLTDTLTDLTDNRFPIRRKANSARAPNRQFRVPH